MNNYLNCRKWVITNFENFVKGSQKIPYKIKNRKDAGEVGKFIDNFFKVPEEFQTENTGINSDGIGYELKSKKVNPDKLHHVVQISCAQSRGPANYMKQKTIEKIGHTLAIVKYHYNELEELIEILSIEIWCDAIKDKLSKALNRTQRHSKSKWPPNFMLSEGKLSDIYNSNLKII